MLKLGLKKEDESFLHIKPPKMTTTGIQNYLHSLKEKLKLIGMLYPASVENASYSPLHANIVNLMLIDEDNLCSGYLHVATGCAIESPERFSSRRERKFSERSICWTYPLRKYYRCFTAKRSIQSLRRLILESLYNQ